MTFGLQNAIDRNPADLAFFFSKCHAHAINVVQVARTYLGPLNYLRYAPESSSVFLAYVSGQSHTARPNLY